MKPLNLEEFATELRRKGDWRESEFGDEILTLIDSEPELEFLDELRGDIAHYAKEFSNPDDASKALEWVGDRSNLLGEIEKALDKDGRTGDVDDQVKALLDLVENIRTILLLPDEATDEDMETAIQGLMDREPKTLEYDL